MKEEKRILKFTIKNSWNCNTIEDFLPKLQTSHQNKLRTIIMSPKQRKMRFSTNETYTIIIMLVLGFQQICGVGTDEKMNLLTFLNLSNGRNMKTNKFKRIEDSSGTMINDVSKKVSRQH